MRNILIHLHSDEELEPAPDVLEFGEIAVQYTADAPRLYIKDTNGTIRTFIDKSSVESIIDNKLSEFGLVSYVDLGLPSGTLWATYNIGASSPDEPGLYFQWGDISGYTRSQVGSTKVFDWSDYKYSTTGGTPTKYVLSGDDKTVLETMDDAAVAMKGNEWVMPTKAQFEELINNTTHSWDWSRSGMTFTANGQELFLLGAGSAVTSSVGNYGYLGDYWSRSLYDYDSHSAWRLYISTGDTCSVSSQTRCYGSSVRPVKLQNN